MENNQKSKCSLLTCTRIKSSTKSESEENELLKELAKVLEAYIAEADKS